LTLRVLVDAHLIGARETGNETYTLNLLHALSDLPNVICGAAILPGRKLPSHLFKVEPVPLKSSGNWNRLLNTLPAACRNWQADVLHVTYVGPFFVACPTVVSVHDVSFKHYPKFFSPRDRLLFATLLPLTLRRARAVVAISNHAKKEIVDVFPYLKEKIYVTFLAADPMFQPLQSVELLRNVRLRYGIRSEYILAVGNLQPRKNLLRLIRAFAFVHRHINDIQLIVVGKAHWQSSAVYSAVKNFGLENHVVFTGYVPNDDLIVLYSFAKVYVYPSLYEGFGLPILEAMACGVPVVSSNTSSMPEVAGDAALLVDPHQEDQIAKAILKILDNTDLATSLSDKGLRRARFFSWRKTAQETVDIYRTVLQQMER